MAEDIDTIPDHTKYEPGDDAVVSADGAIKSGKALSLNCEE